MKLFTKISMLLAVVSSTMALDIPSYYNLDIKVIEISIEGGKERLACLKRGCPIEEQYKIYEKMQEKINTVYANEGTTASKQIGFYSRNSIEARKYYDDNQTLQEKYPSLREERENISQNILMIRGAKQ